MHKNYTNSGGMWIQRSLTIGAKSRGIHLITRNVVDALPELSEVRVGLLHVFIQHTSASLSINENADPSVRGDMEQFLRRLAPDGADYFEHTCEGPDDMTAHLKTSLLGSSLSIPVSEGRLALGTWQGIYLGEHREHREQAGARRLVLTLNGLTNE